MSSAKRMAGRVGETMVAFAHLLRAERGIPERRSVRYRSTRHFLLVAEYLPPDRVMGGSYRPTSFLQHAAANGWKATAITRALTEPPDEAARELATRIPEDCRVIRVRPPAFHASRRVFPTIDGTVEAALAFFDEGRRRLRGTPPSVVVGTGPPFHTFLAAFYLSRRFGTKLLLDYRDEWTESPFAFVSSGKWDRRFETRLLRRADGVLFTTASQIEHALERFPGLRRGKCFLVANGWDPSDAMELAPTTAHHRNPACTTIAFVGNLASHTHPGAFFDMLEALLAERPAWAARIRLRLVGRTDESVRRRLERFPHRAMIDQVGLVPMRQAKREMASADALILFAGPDLARYLPGKLFEYLAARRPIMVYGAQGESASLVTALSAGRRVEGADEFTRFLDDLPELRALLARSPIDEWLEGHRRDVLAGRFFEVLDRVSGQGGWAPGGAP